jgi:hypothetical protein
MTYVPAADIDVHLGEIAMLLDSLRKLPLDGKRLRRILKQAIWEVAYATGNTQSRFLGQYRSESVIQNIGLKIERDHVHQMANLIEELLCADCDVQSIVLKSECCIITREEHLRLTSLPRSIDGWERYRHAEIVVMDMKTGQRMI